MSESALGLKRRGCLATLSAIVKESKAVTVGYRF